jgi:hypothetical protein
VDEVLNYVIPIMCIVPQISPVAFTNSTSPAGAKAHWKLEKAEDVRNNVARYNIIELLYC